MNDNATDETEKNDQPTAPALPQVESAPSGLPPVPPVLPIMPVRNTVMFPGTVVPLDVGRPVSMRLLDESLPTSKVIGLVAQRDPETEDPAPDDLFEIGTAVAVLKLIRQPDESISLLVHGVRRIAIRKIVQTDPFLKADVAELSNIVRPDKWLEAAEKNLRESATELIDLSPQVPDQAKAVLLNIEQPGDLADFLAANLAIELVEKQDILEELDVAKRVRAVQLHISRQLELTKLQVKIQEDVQTSITESQRKMFLREQMRAIQKELGEGEEGTVEQIGELRRKLTEAEPPEKVMAEAERELRRLEVIPSASPEHSVIVTYLETICELPWQKLSKDNLDLDRAQRILDRDHHDLDKVKRRLIEYLAVRKLNPEGRGPIMCFVGPPGVGKTSLGQSIADALGRRFVRLSLGGIRDEAEIRGHRRTYIGSMPGRIIQEMRRAETRNPVMMLDELDKLGADFRGDPASALLEVLDPRQNHAFVDRYLDVAFDLSQVMFISTANYMDPVPPALRDRMEVIELPGYTDGEKLQIARKYLAPRQLKENGLTTKRCRWTAAGIRKVIDGYTREAGVRELERQIGAVCRGIAAKVAAGRQRKTAVIGADAVTTLLGPEPYVRPAKLRRDAPGIVTGLAYTPVGGEVLFIEAAKFDGKGNITLTGQIGDVMKESIHAAMSLVKTRAGQLGIDPDVFAKTDIHVHVPAGAVPKDGPSAGVAMFIAIASLLAGRKVRADVAMTGEITLRGIVLPIGGLKEKTLAAVRAGVKTVIVPAHNEKDLPEMAEDVKKKLDFVFVENVDQVLEAALTTRRKARKR